MTQMSPASHQGALKSAVLLLHLLLLLPAYTADGPGLPTRTWPAGTTIDHRTDIGGRIGFYHRGYYYLRGMHTGGKDTVVDLSSGRLQVVQEQNGNGNAHRWMKFGDLVVLDIHNFTELDGTNQQFLDCSNMLNRRPANLNILQRQQGLGGLAAFPHSFGDGGITDLRSGERLTRRRLIAESGIRANKLARIGDLVLQIPQADRTGVAAWNVSDPANPVLLDVLSGPFTQYTSAVHIWKHYVVLLDGGDDENGPNRENLVVIDFSDPTDLRYRWGLKSNVVTPGRYISFQDDYGFVGAGSFKGGRKIDMRDGSVVLSYESTGDFWHDPVGHLLVVSTGQNFANEVKLIAHQDGLDNRPPTVGWHWPPADSVRVPVTGTIGLVINETLRDTTINATTVRLTGHDNSTVPCTFMTTDYDVVQIVPQQDLQADTTYTLSLVENGIRDVAGNGVAAWSLRFSTGDRLHGGNPAPPPPPADTQPELAGISIVGGSPQATGRIQLRADASDADGDELRYRWDLGDGNGMGSWSSSSTTEANFAPGIYTIQVQVRDEDDHTLAATKGLVVHADNLASGGQQSSQLCLTDAGVLWCVNPDNDTITAMTMRGTPAVQAEHNTGPRPSSIACDADGRLWVACRDDDSLRIHDADNGGQVDSLRLPYGSGPVAIVLASGRNAPAYVVCAGSGKLLRIDQSNPQITGSLSLGPHAYAADLSADGSELLITQRISPSTAGTIWRVNCSTWELAAAIPLPLDTSSEDSSVTGRGLPNYVTAVARHPSSAQAWYVAKKDNIVRGRQRDGQDLSFETTLRALVGMVDLGNNREQVANRIDIDDHGQPSALCFSPLGTHVLVTLQGNNRLMAFDAVTGLPQGQADVGLAPQAVLVDQTSGRIAVKSLTDRGVTILDGQTLLSAGSADIPVLAQLTTVSNEKMSTTVLRGKQVFYNAADPRMAADGYLSCASCHDDGGHDGRVWDFTHRGEGMRNTTTLHGRRGMGHGNVHWTGNFDEIQDFENDIRQAFGGTGFLTEQQFRAGTRADTLGDPKAGLSADLDALAAYVSSLSTVPRSPHRNDDGSLTAAAQRGREHFRRLDCASCHAGADFTDSAQGLRHDVGSITAASGNRLDQALDGIDTPGLRGVWETAPYLHHGAATNLTQVFTATAGHGGSQSLNADEVQELVAYLMALDDSDEQPGRVGQQPPSAGFTAARLTHAADGADRAQVRCDASTSADTDGTIASYAWSWAGASANGRIADLTLPLGTTIVTLVVTDNDGLTARSSQALTVVAAEMRDVITSDSDLIVIEAESHHRQRNASGGDAWQGRRDQLDGTRYVSPQNNDGDNYKNSTDGAVLVYDLYVPEAGTWFGWVRLRGANRNDDSVHLGLEQPATRRGEGLKDDSNTWTWIGHADGLACRLDMPSPGIHSLRLWQREDGVDIDRILLTQDSSYTPSGVGPAASGTWPERAMPQLNLSGKRFLMLPENQTVLSAEALLPNGSTLVPQWHSDDQVTLNQNQGSEVNASFPGTGHFTIMVSAEAGGERSEERIGVTVVPERPVFILGVNCGGPEVQDAAGQIFNADDDSTVTRQGGEALQITPAIGGTEADELFRSMRSGSSSYRVSLPNGDYQLALHFVEPQGQQIGQRVMQVSVNGQNHSGIDIIAEVNRRFAAYTRTIPVTVSDGELHLEINAEVGVPVISAFSILQSGSNG